jgi:Polyketide cyclase / dehydrase and lipid transport
VIEVTHAAGYPRPAEAIFAVLTDFAAHPAWRTDVESASLTNGQHAQVGNGVHQVRKVVGPHTEVDLTITELVPGQLPYSVHR